MKKLLLSLFTVAAAAFTLSAETVTFDFSEPSTWGYEGEANKGTDYTSTMPISMGDVTMAVDTKNAQTGGGMFRFWYPQNTASAKDFRCSSKGGKLGQTLTFTADGNVITKIEFTAAKFALKAEPGTLGAYENKAATWEGSAEEVVFTTTEANTLNKIIVTYEAAGSDVKKPAGLAWSKTEVDVDVDFIEEFEAPTLANPNNLTVSYTSSNETVATVNETTGVVALEGEEGSTVITASFAGNDQFRAQEVSYTITVKAKAAAVASVAETKALAANTEFTVGYELTVGFINYSNIFAVDAAGDFIQIYSKDSGLKVGDKLPAGWTGKYVLFGGTTPEIEPVGKLPAATAGTFEPKAVAAADVTTELVNSVITIKDVVFETATPATKENFTGKVGDIELSFRNNYTKPGVEAGTYDVTVVVTIYQGATSLYIVEYKTPGGETPDPIEPEVTKVSNLAEAFALANDTEAVIDCPLTVGFVNYSNIFVRDEAGNFIQIYGSNSYKIGDVIPAGWKGTYSVFNNAPQFKPVGTLPEATEGTFTPEVVAAANVSTDLVNHVITIENVVLAEASPAAKENFTGKVGDVELSLRNNYKLESVEAGTYNITVVVNNFKGDASLYVTNFVKATTSGIEEIEAADAEAVYYNLQGVRVENPENGLYIRVRGNKIDKVVK